MRFTRQKVFQSLIVIDARASPRRGATPRTKGLELASRAKAMMSGFPSNVEAQIKRRPYATLGIVGVIGMGAGILLGSRILRSALASGASYAAVELARAYVRQKAAPAQDSGRTLSVS
jgi:hypothetical protein